MILIIDNTRNDKNTYLGKIESIFNNHKLPFIKVSSIDDLSKIKIYEITAVLISESPPVRDKSSENKENIELNKLAMEMFIDKAAIVGICFGCQFINTYFGGTLKKLDNVYCETGLVHFKNHKKIHIQYCLRYIIDRLAPDFKPLAHSVLHGITFPSMIAHKTKEIYGMLFHPEFLEETEFILHNLFKSFF